MARSVHKEGEKEMYMSYIQRTNKKISFKVYKVCRGQKMRIDNEVQCALYRDNEHKKYVSMR